MNEQHQNNRFASCRKHVTAPSPKAAPAPYIPSQRAWAPPLSRGTEPPPYFPPPSPFHPGHPAPRWRPPPSFRSRYDSMMPPPPPSRAAATRPYPTQHHAPRSPRAKKNARDGISGADVEHTEQRKLPSEGTNESDFKGTTVNASSHDRRPVPLPLFREQTSIKPENNAPSKLTNVKQEKSEKEPNRATKSCLKRPIDRSKEFSSRKRLRPSLKNEKNEIMSKRLKTGFIKVESVNKEVVHSTTQLTTEMKKDVPAMKPSSDLSLTSDRRESDLSSDTHVIFVIDSSSSMRKRDVKSSQGNISRWEAVFKCIDSFLDEQLQEQALTSNTSCFVSVVIFNTKSRILLNRMLLEGDGASVRAALQRQKVRNKPRDGTHFSAGLKQASTLANSGPGNDKIVLVFLTDGRPGDLASKPPKIGSEMQTTFKSNKKINHAAGYYISQMQQAHMQFHLQLICLYDEGKRWLEYLSSQYNGMLHNPDLSLDDNDLEVVPMQVKSSRTVMREKYEAAQAANEVISITGTTIGTRSSIRSTFSSISATVTAMRGTKRTERSVIIVPDSAMISYDATRMTLTEDSNGDIVFATAPGETSNSRTVQLSMHPFAQGGLRNVYRMKQFDPETENVFTAVAKESRHDIHYNERLKFHLETAINQLKAHKWAKKFQRAIRDVDDSSENAIPEIKVLRTEVYRLKSANSPGGFRYLAVENELKGPYQKWNNNDGYVNPSQCHQCLVAQAFSHFTYEKSNHREMVVDIQGSGYVYTDPQLHSEEKSYGRADRGPTGFKKFLETHQCNSVCKKLMLPDPKSIA